MWSPAALNLHVMQETWVRFLSGEDPLEKKMATHSSSLACRIPRTEEPSRLQSMGSQWVSHDWATFTFFQYQERYPFIIIVVVQVLSHASLFSVPWTAASHASLSFTTSQSLLKLVSIELRIPSSHLVLYHPLLLLPSIFSSNTVFSNESALHIRWPKYWSFSISPSNEYSEFISLGLTGLIYLLSIGERKKVRKLSFLSFFFPSP